MHLLVLFRSFDFLLILFFSLLLNKLSDCDLTAFSVQNQRSGNYIYIKDSLEYDKDQIKHKKKALQLKKSCTHVGFGGRE